MIDNTLSPEEAEQARLDLSSYKPLWCRPDANYTYWDVLQARHDGDLDRLTTASLGLALRGHRHPNDGGSVTVFEARRTTGYCRLLASWIDKNNTQLATGCITLIPGLTRRQAERECQEQGVPPVLFAGWETGGRILVIQENGEEDVGWFTVEALANQIAQIKGAHQVVVEYEGRGFIAGMIRAAFERQVRQRRYDPQPSPPGST